MKKIIFSLDKLFVRVVVALLTVGKDGLFPGVARSRCDPLRVEGVLPLIKAAERWGGKYMVSLPDTPDYRKVKDFVAKFKGDESSLIRVLHFSQGIFGYLPPDVIEYVAQELNVPASHVYGVISFYNFFRTEPLGEYEIRVCLGTACHVKGSKEVLETLCRKLGVKVGGTSKDGKFTVTTVRCVGACPLAPVMVIGDDVHGRLSPQKAWNVVKGYYEKEGE